MGASTVVASNMQRMMKVCFINGSRWEKSGSKDKKKPTSPVEGYDLKTAIKPIIVVVSRRGCDGNLIERGAT